MTNPIKLGARWRLKDQVKALRAACSHYPFSAVRKLSCPPPKTVKIGLRPGSNYSPKVTHKYKNVIKDCLFR